MFAGEVGVPRILKFLNRLGHQGDLVRTKTFDREVPEEISHVAKAGHESGLHGYSHENPVAMSPDQEEAILVKSSRLVEEVQGFPPAGYCAPWSELSPATIRLLLKYGIVYDHSLMHRDFQPYYLRMGDSWTKIDLSLPAASWMKPLKRGKATKLVEIPIGCTLMTCPR